MKEDQRIGENIRVDTKVIEGDCPHRSVAHMDANFLEVLDLRRNLRERVERDGTDGDVAEVATAEFADLLSVAVVDRDGVLALQIFEEPLPLRGRLEDEVLK